LPSPDPLSNKPPAIFSGLVFDIKEFALFDGPGLRCTVFFKGCPLRCSWCHNPEGLEQAPEVLQSGAGSRTCGVYYGLADLAERLLRYAPVFEGTEGGVTLSGGEPLMQGEFVQKLMLLLKGKLHLLLQTSGYAPEKVFLDTASLADMVYFDFKLADPLEHKKHTGKDNAPILKNLRALDHSGIPYRLRLPLIPGLTDTPENYRGIGDFIEKFLCSGNNLQGLDLLSYNPAAGGKYKAAGRVFAPDFDERRPPNPDPDFFKGLVKEVTLI
jgi:pyruvate formate lyase activating enzyme